MDQERLASEDGPYRSSRDDLLGYLPCLPGSLACFVRCQELHQEQR